MQDRYAGDIGDFLKLGLLRALSCAAAGLPGLRVGVVWYLVPDESHNQDGRHVAYLDTSRPLSDRLRRCDPDLYDRLARLVASGARSVEALEGSGVLPENSRTAPEVLSFASIGATSASGRIARVARRAAWLESAVSATAGCDVVFLDPDNGIAAEGARPHLLPAIKYAFAQELLPFLDREQSVIVYQHADRSTNVRTQAQRKLQLLQSVLGVDPIGAVRSLRGPCRLFLVVPAAQHRDQLERRLEAMTQRGPWSDHLTLLPLEMRSCQRDSSKTRVMRRP
jgi:hypothetical protein